LSIETTFQEEEISEESIEEGGSNEEGTMLLASEISLDIEEGTVITKEEVNVTIPDNREISAFKIYVSSEILTEITQKPFNFNIPVTAYDDGELELKIEAILDGSVIATRIFAFKIDNNGPSLSLDGVMDRMMFCGEFEVNPTITDEVSEIKNVTVLVGETHVGDFNSDTGYSFLITPELC
jgi:hypothetical protein